MKKIDINREWNDYCFLTNVARILYFINFLIFEAVIFVSVYFTVEDPEEQKLLFCAMTAFAIVQYFLMQSLNNILREITLRKLLKHLSFSVILSRGYSFNTRSRYLHRKMMQELEPEFRSR